jgi:hypothetical protein
MIPPCKVVRDRVWNISGERVSQHCWFLSLKRRSDGSSGRSFLSLKRRSDGSSGRSLVERVAYEYVELKVFVLSCLVIRPIGGGVGLQSGTHYRWQILSDDRSQIFKKIWPSRSSCDIFCTFLKMLLGKRRRSQNLNDRQNSKKEASAGCDLV